LKLTVQHSAFRRQAICTIFGRILYRLLRVDITHNKAIRPPVHRKVFPISTKFGM